MYTKELIELGKQSNESSFEVILAEKGITKNELIHELTKRLVTETTPKVGDSYGAFMQKKMSDFLNNTICDEKGFVEQVFKDHRTLQQNMFRLILRIVEGFSKLEDCQFDGRNEASVRKARIMIDALNKANEGIGCPMI